jgi:adenine-specific DNA glycosylase
MRAAAKAPVRVRLAAIAVRRRGEVLLVRRNGGSLMRGMWEFPMVPDGGHESVEETGRRLRARIAGKLGEVRHTITRHRIAISVYGASPSRSKPGRRRADGPVVLSEAAGRLATGWSDGDGRWEPLERLVSARGDIALTGTARKIARLLMSQARRRSVGAMA